MKQMQKQNSAEKLKICSKSSPIGFQVLRRTDVSKKVIREIIHLATE